MNPATQLFTIGHSDREIEIFVALLKKHGITAVADVRSHPYSRYLPHFNKAELQSALNIAGIQYVFLGQELGARPSDRACYVDGKAIYEKIAVTDAFQQGIQRILNGAKQYTIALMCAEQDPLTCHRAILVCQHLRSFDLVIHHILKDETIESHTDLENRLLAKHGFDKLLENLNQKQLALFGMPEVWQPQSREEALTEAYKLQGEKIAHVEQETAEQVDV